MMHSTNQRCNALQSVVGVFLHSCNAPETVRELLAHMGLSVSANTIHNAITNLSKEAGKGIRQLGQNLLTLYAYDNLDIDLKHSVPTVEKQQDTLIHITSGTMIPLCHGAKFEDLNCSDELWRKYRHNLEARADDIPSISIESLLNLHPEEGHTSGLTRRRRFNAWKYLYDLVHFGPEYFRKFQRQLGDPEVIDGIPVTKTFQVPLRGVDVSPSTPGQNAEALDSFFQQAGVGDPTDKPGVKAVGNSVILVSGDLLTIQHLRSLQESRAEESTPWCRVQFPILVMGLFHLKMGHAPIPFGEFSSITKPPNLIAMT